jgi:hypothetical protein
MRQVFNGIVNENFIEIPTLCSGDAHFSLRTTRSTCSFIWSMRSGAKRNRVQRDCAVNMASYGVRVAEIVWGKSG